MKAAIQCDVLVAGAGIAGIRAAIAAARKGKRVVLASSGATFSGSSFYPGTWGLGLIGPEGPEDEADLAASIQRLGCGMADPELVESFVSGITPAIAELKAMGVRLKQADAGAQREFIPCFDHKHRAWNGILFDSAKEVLGAELERLGVVRLPGCEMLELTRSEGRVDGAVVRLPEGIRWIKSGAVVLCTGGFGGLYQHRLTTGDVAGAGQWLALQAGASLVNLEFMQMMPGYVSPCANTIFNEKTFRWLRLTGPDGQDILADVEEEGLDGAALLEQRAGHGPFTSRLADRAVDFAILEHQGCEGVLASYLPEMKQDPPEFVRTYFDWLQEAKGLTWDDPIRIAIFAHAANGGVRIDPQGFTGIPGLYAAGEVTGGMHGADRIGGLSTANGLVFGARAGAAAAEDARHTGRTSAPFERWHLPDAAERRSEMQALMTRYALVRRTETGLAAALERVNGLRAAAPVSGGSDAQAADSRRLMAQLGLAACVLTAQRVRTESRGSHCRADHPGQDERQARPILLRLEDGTIRADFA